MEMTRLEDLAGAATTGHWMPHLVAPDEDKIHVLGAALKAAIDRIWHLESVEDQAAALEEENGFLRGDLEIYKGKLRHIREIADVPPKQEDAG